MSCHDTLLEIVSLEQETREGRRMSTTSRKNVSLTIACLDPRPRRPPYPKLSCNETNLAYAFGGEIVGVSLERQVNHTAWKHFGAGWTKHG